MTDTVKIAVCDDEKNIRAYLISLIKKQDIECNIMEYESADKYLSDGREYDLLFLDIEMGGSGVGMDGMELARNIRAVGQIASEAEKRRKKLVIPYAGGSKSISFHDIYYMESQNHNIVLYLKSGNSACTSRLEYYGKIGDLEKELAGQFYRIHRGYLINLFHVESYDRTEVRMANGDKLLLSRYKYDSFVQAYMEYISEESQ